MAWTLHPTPPHSLPAPSLISAISNKETTLSLSPLRYLKIKPFVTHQCLSLTRQSFGHLVVPHLSKFPPTFSDSQIILVTIVLPLHNKLYTETMFRSMVNGHLEPWQLRV